ncbi:MAG: 5-formyltetrahydrofolate cyclo-ligase [Idiomarina sp.]|nr:5-formyltetrahydrofolate cyclo-ligase [Idiomarina sp.]
MPNSSSKSTATDANTVMQNSTQQNLLRQQLRAKYRAARQALSAEQQQQASAAIAKHLTDMVSAAPVRCVAAYIANDGEPSLEATIQALWQRGITVALPVLHPVVPNQLLFLRYHANTEMVANKFNIPEPRIRCQDIIPLSAIDLVCMPLVAFDAHGNRLGMGGGFYDRTLAGCSMNRYPNLQRVGIAHDCQYTEQLPVASWDVPIAQIVTPCRSWQFNTSSGND